MNEIPNDWGEVEKYLDVSEVKECLSRIADALEIIALNSGYDESRTHYEMTWQDKSWVLHDDKSYEHYKADANLVSRIRTQNRNYAKKVTNKK